ncbi:MAG: nuclear transport factor 2 family protein [Acidimicrobiia bacterium]|jgi:ketosteroid isomerase-like protein|nr:nuclear transport factor 2 family protein [Acidimicrobiia bacterium]
MYKAAIRTLLRRQIDQLNSGNHEPLRKMAAPNAELTFPGDNSWSRQFRTPQATRAPHSTHRGVAELEAFAQRFVDSRLRIDVEDILVNGPPWNTRICVRATDGATDETGAEIYNNRIVLFIESRWGKIQRWEDYLDTERVTAWDRKVGLDDRPPQVATG